ncbi:EamA family transporter [Plantactinospora sp. GCM10030261]|uniref:EamA family transporter n=1 Tax=Plantactinospora sp. GCM10030261 TaxID=3273420 RepID=UPI00361A3202
MTLAVGLALVAAMAYGVSDFVGGCASRLVTPWAIVLTGQVGGGLAMLIVAANSPGTMVVAHLAWAVLAGTSSAAGTVFLYRGLSTGHSALVAPSSAVVAATVPVMTAVVGGERPQMMVWAGIALSLPGIWLVAASSGKAPRPAGHASALRDGILSGMGFGGLFAAVGQIPSSAGMFPLALQNVAAGLFTVVAAVMLGQTWVPSTARAWVGLPIGVLGATGTAVFMVATQAGQLSVTSVVVSLYPVFTVALSMLFLRERVGRPQSVGLVLSGIAVACIAAG